jgi:HEAT repeat protein
VVANALEVEAALSQLVESGDRKALARFVGLGDAALPTVRRGLSHPHWRVRRDCLRFLDHHVDGESARIALDLLLHDEHPEVRKWAAHALGCDHCKSGAALGFDPVPPLMAVAVEDPSLRVRRGATVSLMARPPDSRIHAFLASLLASETDAKIRLHAQYGLARHAAASP